MTGELSSGAHLTLEHSIECSRRLAAAAADAGFQPHVVVGVLEGGILPARIVATALDARLAVLRVRRPASSLKHSTMGRLLAKAISGLYDRLLIVRRLAELANRADRRSVQVPPAAALRAGESRVLVIDDSSESGITLRVAKGAMAGAASVDVRTAVITWLRGRRTTAIEPDFHLYECWLQFPWSTNSPDYARYMEWRRRHFTTEEN